MGGWDLFGLAHAGQVRTLYANDKSMQSVFLAMGRSTVLRFDEKPKSTIVGNKNYLNVEYIGNDIALQPLGRTSTNMFVHTESQTYGLILKPGTESHYDDLVIVRWRPGFMNITERPKTKSLVTERAMNQTSELKGQLKVYLKRQINSQAQGIQILELAVENLSQTLSLPLTELRLVLIGRDKKEFLIQRLVLQKETLGPKERTDGRLIYRLDYQGPYSLVVFYKKQGVGAPIHFRGTP